MTFEVKIVASKDAPDFDGYNDDYSSTLLIISDGKVILQQSDGGEPEDQSFYRDWAWVAPALRTAYELGVIDGKHTVKPD